MRPVRDRGRIPLEAFFQSFRRISAVVKMKSRYVIVEQASNRTHKIHSKMS